MTVALPTVLQAQSYDLLLKGGHLVDPKNEIDRPMDLAVSDGEVARVAESIPESEAGQVIQREDLEHMSEGAVADIAVFSHREGDFGFLDSDLERKPGTEKLEPELTLREGRVVWDLNGLASSNWDE